MSCDPPPSVLVSLINNGTTYDLENQVVRLTFDNSIISRFHKFRSSRLVFTVETEELLDQLSPFKNEDISPGARVNISAIYNAITYEIYSGSVLSTSITQSTTKQLLTIVCDNDSAALRGDGVFYNNGSDARVRLEVVARLDCNAITDVTIDESPISIIMLKDGDRSIDFISTLLNYNESWGWMHYSTTQNETLRFTAVPYEALADSTAIASYDEFLFFSAHKSNVNLFNIITNISDQRELFSDFENGSFLGNFYSSFDLNSPLEIPAGQSVQLTLKTIDNETKEIGAPGTIVLGPPGTQQYQASSDVGGSDNAMSAFLSVSQINIPLASRNAALGIVDLEMSNNHASDTLYLISYRAGTTGSYRRISGSYYTAKDQDSIDKNGERSLLISNLLQQNREEIKSTTDKVLNIYKNPIDIVKCKIKNKFPDCLQRQVGDIINISNILSGINKKMICTNIEHNITLTRGTEWTTSMTLESHNLPVTLQTITIDNTDAEAATLGTWAESSATNEVGGSSIFTNTAASSIIYEFAVTQAGTYEVQTWTATHANRTSSAPFEINNGGSTTAIIVNQTQNQASWFTIHSAFFAAGNHFVLISAAAAGNTGADAVRFQQVS